MRLSLYAFWAGVARDCRRWEAVSRATENEFLPSAHLRRPVCCAPKGVSSGKTELSRAGCKRLQLLRKLCRILLPGARHARHHRGCFSSAVPLVPSLRRAAKKEINGKLS